jgi:hypothetical protein
VIEPEKLWRVAAKSGLNLQTESRVPSPLTALPSSTSSLVVKMVRYRLSYSPFVSIVQVLDVVLVMDVMDEFPDHWMLPFSLPRKRHQKKKPPSL